MQARIDNFGKFSTTVINKESFGGSKKSVELLTRMEQLIISYENTLTGFYEQRNQIKNSQNNW